MSTTTLAGFIRSKPAIVAIRCDGDDKRIVRIAGRQYAIAEKAVVSLDASTLEGLDETGAIVRTFAVKEPTSSASSAASSRSVETWPEGEASQLAQVIALACDRAAERHERAYRASFDTITGLYREQSLRLAQLENNAHELQMARLAAAERAADEANADADEAHAQLAEAGPSTADGMVAAVLGHVAEKALTGSTNGASS